MTRRPTVQQLLDDAKRTILRLEADLTMRRDDLDPTGAHATGRELVDQTLAAAQNVLRAIERSPGGSINSRGSSEEP